MEKSRPSTSQEPARLAFTYAHLAGTRPALFPPLFFGPSLFRRCHIERSNLPFTGVGDKLGVILDLGLGAARPQGHHTAVLQDEGNHVTGLTGGQNLVKR